MKAKIDSSIIHERFLVSLDSPLLFNPQSFTFVWLLLTCLSAHFQSKVLYSYPAGNPGWKWNCLIFCFNSSETLYSVLSFLVSCKIVVLLYRPENFSFLYIKQLSYYDAISCRFWESEFQKLIFLINCFSRIVCLDKNVVTFVKPG